MQVRQCDLPGISPVTNCPRLSLLDASWNTHVTTVQPIVQCTALTELTLRGCRRLHDVGVLSHLPQLTVLDVSFTPVTTLPDLPSLRVLGIFACHRLQACPQLSCTLNHLDAGSCRVDDTWLEQISCCTNLRSLELVGCEVTDAGVEGVLRACPMLEYLNVAGNRSEF